MNFISTLTEKAAELEPVLKAAAIKYGPKLFDAGIKAIGKKAMNSKDQKVQQRYAQEWINEYLEQLQQRICHVQILGMPHPIQLQDLFVSPNFYECPARETFRGDKDEPTRSARKASRSKEKLLSLTDILEKKSIVILGDPGAGKSTVLRYVALSNILNNSSVLPIYIELRQINSKIKSIEEYLLRDADDESKKFLTKALLGVIKEGDCIILFDALDEVAINRRSALINLIQNFSERYRRCPIIVSCRTATYNHELKGINLYEITDFNDDQKHTFIDSWFTAIKKENYVTRLEKLISRDAGVSEITTNPLLLSLVCLLFDRDIQLPKQRAQLYKRCIEVLIREWDTERGFRRETSFEHLSDQDRISLFADIAQYFFKKNIRYFSKDDIFKFVLDIAIDYEIDTNTLDELLNELESHHGIIVKVGADEYGFSHTTFQEYLTAFYYTSRQLSYQIVEELSQDFRWIEVLLLAAGSLSSIGVLSDSIISNRRQRLSPLSKVNVIIRLFNENVRFDSISKKRITKYTQRVLKYYFNVGFEYKIDQKGDILEAVIYDILSEKDVKKWKIEMHFDYNIVRMLSDILNQRSLARELLKVKLPEALHCLLKDTPHGTLGGLEWAVTSSRHPGELGIEIKFRTKLHV
ncbi:NACHT domain-containing protein [bacterium]|nr:NACHT domain-containing protein [bacterium]